MFVGEVIFGGVGSGLYGMLLYVLLAVFVSGLMVGRTPEYLGKKIEAREIKIVLLGVLFPPAMVLVMTALAVTLALGTRLDLQPRAARILGGALRLYVAGEQQRERLRRLRRDELLDAARRRRDDPRRFVPLVAALAVAGSLAAKKTAPASAGTFRTDSPTFVVVLVGVIVIVSALTILPGARARADRRVAHHGAVLMLKIAFRSLVAVVVLDRRPRLRLPGRHHRHRAARLPERADGSIVEVGGKPVGSRLAAQAFDGARLLPPPPSADGLQRRGNELREPRPDEQGAAEPTFGERAQAILALERPVQPGPRPSATSPSTRSPPRARASTRTSRRRTRGCRPRASPRPRPLASSASQELVDDATDGPLRSASSASRASTSSSSTSHWTGRRR